MTGEAAVHLQDRASWASFPAPLQRGGTRGIVRRSLPLPPSPSPSEGPQRSSQGSTTRTPPQLLPRCGIVPCCQFRLLPRSPLWRGVLHWKYGASCSLFLTALARKAARLFCLLLCFPSSILLPGQEFFSPKSSPLRLPLPRKPSRRGSHQGSRHPPSSRHTASKPRKRPRGI